MKEGRNVMALDAQALNRRRNSGYLQPDEADPTAHPLYHDLTFIVNIKLTL